MVFQNKCMLFAQVKYIIHGQLHPLLIKFQNEHHQSLLEESWSIKDINTKHLLAGDGVLHPLVGGWLWSPWREGSGSPPMTGGKSKGYGAAG